MKKYLICNIGCDDSTSKEFNFTDEQYLFLDTVFKELNKESTYGCMPTIYIDAVGE